MRNNKKLSVIFMVRALDKIFGNDLRKILLSGFGIDINKIKRISILENEFYILKNFYDSETENHRKNIRKYKFYEQVIKKNKSKLTVKKINNIISMKNWEGTIKLDNETLYDWSNGIGLIKKENLNVNLNKI